MTKHPILTGRKFHGNVTSRQYVLGNFIAEGGEGSIYDVNGYSQYVAKIYHNVPDGTLRRKLTYMTSAPKPYDTEHIAWPIEVLSENSTVKGYLMKKITGTKVLDNIITDPKFSFKDRIKLAYNISVITCCMHMANHVIGDYNPKNVMVDYNKGFTYLVDCDSFHVTDVKTKYVYKCSVGMGRYIAPELANKMKNTNTDLASIQGTSFTKQTDLFALAIHIFSYLVNGRHPFDMALLSSATSSKTVPDSLDSISKGYYIYSKNVQNRSFATHLNYLIVPPDAKKAFEGLPNEFKDYFEKAFVNGYADPLLRPTSEDWCKLLKKYI